MLRHTPHLCALHIDDGSAMGNTTLWKMVGDCMTHDWRNVLAQQATSVVARFVATHPGFTIDTSQPDYRGGTNFVTFGHYQQQPVVFKYFVTKERWLNEHVCLHHFASTGYVPRILAIVPEQVIVMSRLSGQGLGDGGLQREHIPQVSHEIGVGLAALTQTPLPAVSSGYSPVRDFQLILWGNDLRLVLTQYLQRCRRAQQAIAAYQVPFFTEAVALVEHEVDTIARQPRLLFHEDISNVAIHHGTFTGFYDFEMCRMGTEAMQLGVAVGLCAPQELDWRHLINGYQAQVGRTFDEGDFTAMLAMKHFYHLIRICRWGTWDGTAAQEQHMQASAEDAAWHLTHMREACAVLRDWVNIGRWFPSLGSG